MRCVAKRLASIVLKMRLPSRKGEAELAKACFDLMQRYNHIALLDKEDRMIRRTISGASVPSFGFGTMRMPIVDGDIAKVDEDALKEMVDYAMDHGVNYFDLGYGYHGGNDEISVCKVLREYPRESYLIADKFPIYDLSHFERIEEIFELQLERTQLDYFDFYLLHNVCEMNLESTLSEELGLMEFLLEKKRQGVIRHLGLSTHGTAETMRAFFDRFGEHMEFCQIQLNWVDWDFQDARSKVGLLNSLDIPIIVMEPLRGGKLAELTEKSRAKLEQLRPGSNAVSWAFDFLQSVPGVACVLSGVSNMDQLVENVAIFNEPAPTTPEENEVLFGLAEEMTAKGTVPCTSCRYCIEYCPAGLDIPDLLRLYNEHAYTEGGFIAFFGLMAIGEGKQPSDCIGCGACARVCPQQIDIPGALADFAEMMKPKDE